MNGLGRLLRLSLRVLLVLVSTVLAAGLWLLGTPEGVRLALVQAQPYLPLQLQVQQLDGIAGRGLRLRGLRVQQGELQLEIARLALDWEPMALLGGTLPLRIRASGVTLHLPPTPPEPEPDPNTPLLAPLTLPPAWQLPFLHQVQASIWVRDLHLHRAQQPPQRLDNLYLRAQVSGSQVVLADAEVQLPQVQARLSGQVQAQDDWPLQLEAHWQAPSPQGLLRGTTALAGSLRQLTLHQQLITPQTLNAQVQVQLFQPQPQLDLTLSWPNLHWPPQQPELQLGAGQLTLHGPVDALQAKFQCAELTAGSQTLRDLALALQTRLELRQALPFTVSGTWQFQHPEAAAQGQFQATGDRTRLILTHHLKQPATLNTEAQLQVADLKFDVRNQWENLRWPLTGTPQFASASGSFNASGQPQQYQLALQLAATAPDLPAAQLQFTGQGNTQALPQWQARLDTLDGTLRAEGAAAWQPVPSWQVQLHGDQLNPGVQWREWPGKLGFVLRSTGKLVQGQPELDVVLEQLEGQLRNYPLGGTLTARLAGQQVQLDKLSLRSGSAQLTAQGQLDARQQLSAQFTLNAPNLAHLLPQASGRVQAEGQLGGPLLTPYAKLQFQARQVQIPAAQVQLAELAGTAQVDVSGQQNSRVELDVRQLRQADTEVSHLKLRAQGTPATHTLELNTQAQGHQLDSRWQGQWQAQTAQWRGVWERLQLDGPQTGRWQLAEAWPLAATAQSVQASQPGCLVQAEARLCVQGQWRPQGFNGQLDLQGVDARTVGRFLPPDLTWQGQLAGQVQVRGKADLASLQLDANLTPQAGELRYRRDQDTLSVRYQGVQASARIQNRSLTSQAQIRLASGAHLEAQLNAQPLFGPPEKTLLKGTLQGAVSEWGLLSALVPAVEQVQGQLAIDLQLGGTLARPVPQGRVALTQGSLTVAPAGLNLQALELSADALPDQPIRLQGQVRSGEGHLSWQGQLTPDPDQGWPLQLALAGQQFLIANTPEAQARISPALQVRHDRNGLHLRGTLEVPKALLSLRELPQGAVAVSTDARRMDQPPAAAPLPLDVELAVKLGEDVRFNGFGLKAQLGGQLQIRERGRGAPEGFGDLLIVEGSYRSYGQNLSVRNGRILFAGPLDNPLLQLQAERTVGEVVAGLAVSGSARTPQTRIYAKPPMEQSDALGYLILGRPLSGGGAGGGLAEAAAAAGLGSASDLTQSTGQGLGLDEAGLSTTGGLSAAGLTLGKYLTPRLYASVGVGLFDAQKTLNLRYQLHKRLQIQLQSGTQSAIDLLYVREYAR